MIPNPICMEKQPKVKFISQVFNLPCLVDAENFDFNTDEFGPDQRQNVAFAFQRDYLVEVNLRPEIGDIVNWNDGYFEINAFNENQLVGGNTDNNHSIYSNCTSNKIINNKY